MFPEPFMQLCQLLAFSCTVFIADVHLNWVKELNHFASLAIEVKSGEERRN